MAFIRVADIIINEHWVAFLKPDGEDVIVSFKGDPSGCQELRFSGADAQALVYHFRAHAEVIEPIAKAAKPAATVEDKVEGLVAELNHKFRGSDEHLTLAMHRVRHYIAYELKCNEEQITKAHIYRFILDAPRAVLLKIRNIGPKAIAKMVEEAKQFKGYAAEVCTPDVKIFTIDKTP